MQLPRNKAGAILMWCGFPRRRLAFPPSASMLDFYGLRVTEATEQTSRDSPWMENRRSSFEYDDLLACARGDLSGAANAQLPLPPMLMFDRISEIAEAGGEYGKGLVR